MFYVFLWVHTIQLRIENTKNMLNSSFKCTNDNSIGSLLISSVWINGSECTVSFSSYNSLLISFAILDKFDESEQHTQQIHTRLAKMLFRFYVDGFSSMWQIYEATQNPTRIPWSLIMFGSHKEIYYIWMSSYSRKVKNLL